VRSQKLFIPLFDGKWPPVNLIWGGERAKYLDTTGIWLLTKPRILSVFNRMQSLLNSDIRVETKGRTLYIQPISPDDGENYMYGYYDKHQTDALNSRAIVLQIPFYNREPKTNDYAFVGWTDAKRSFHPIAKTSAWNLQQGSMAEWINPTEVIFNIRHDSGLFNAVIYSTLNFEDCTLKKQYDVPVYAYDYTHKRFASISFERLHNLRRGYGYTSPLSNIDKCPDDDGIWIVDSNGLKTLVFTYVDLKNFLFDTGGVDKYTKLKHHDKVPTSPKYWWVNHIMWSTDGKRISFILRASSQLHGHSYQFSTLMMADIGKKELWRVPTLRGSHPFHHDTLLNCEDKGSYEINYKTSVKQLPWQKGVDGHCSKHPNMEKYVTDTYPRPSKDLIVVNNKLEITKLGTYLPGNEGPVFTRCDLHPRWSTKGDYILFDSTHMGKKRAVYKIQISEPVENIVNTSCRHILFDFGANIGMHARFVYESEKYSANGRPALSEMYKFFDRHFGKKRHHVCVFGIEANEKRCPKLQKLMNVYKTNKWHVNYSCPYAVWNTKTILHFEDKNGIGDGTASKVVNSDTGTMVHTISVVDYVSNILNKFKPDTVLMKMDIEGAEYEVLPALEENGLLCANKIQAMTIEYHWRFTKYSKKWSVPNTFHCDKKTKFIELDSEDYVKDGKPL